MIMKRTFPPGTVVRYADDHEGNEDRSYRVVFDWDEPKGIVQMKLSALMPDCPEPEMETASTDHLVIIPHCKRDGSIDLA